MSQSRLLDFAVLNNDLILRVYHTIEYHIEYNEQQIHSQSCRLDISTKFGKHIESHEMKLHAKDNLKKISILEFSSRAGFIVQCSCDGITILAPYKLTGQVNPCLHSFSHHRISDLTHLGIFPDDTNTQSPSLKLDLICVINTKPFFAKLQDQSLQLKIVETEMDITPDIKKILVLPNGRIITVHIDGVMAWDDCTSESDKWTDLNFSNPGVEPKTLWLPQPHERFILFTTVDVTWTITEAGLPSTGRHTYKTTRPEKRFYSWSNTFKNPSRLDDIDHDIEAWVPLSDGSLATLHTYQNKSAVTIYKSNGQNSIANYTKQAEHLFTEKLFSIGVLSNQRLVTCDYAGKLNFYNTHVSHQFKHLKHIDNCLAADEKDMTHSSVVSLIYGYLGLFHPGQALETKRKGNQPQELIEAKDLPRSSSCNIL